MKLDQFIKQQGMTQTQFAKRTGLSVSSISRIVNGEREPKLEGYADNL